jgi:alpha-beta hydrolase superfamily lysophospholipase
MRRQTGSLEIDCKIAKIITPNKFLLNGLWFGPENSKRTIIFIHGLTGSAFSTFKIVSKFISKDTSVLTFSNRGSSKISKVKRLDNRKKKGSKSFIAGEAHEIFTDCVDDIQGAINLVNTLGIKEVFLMGHSTGCQKSIYYLSQRGNQKKIKGVILLSPLSDYADFVKNIDKKLAEKLQGIAQDLINKNTPHQLMPIDLWPEIHDAQRFLSLYTPNSAEEIFCYAQKGKKPTTFRKVQIPMLVILGEKDNYRDRPISRIVNWFKKMTRAKNMTIEVVKNATHGFERHEIGVSKIVSLWISALN